MGTKMKKQSHSAGFGLVEVLAIAVVVSLMAIVGYFVYTAMNKPAPTQNTDTNAVQDAQEPSTSEYAEVKDWGVKVALRDYDKVQFTIRNQEGELASGGRYQGSANPSFKPEFVADDSCEPGLGLYRSMTSSAERTEKKIGDYYYFIAGGPGACSDDPANNPDDQLKTRFLQDFTLQNLSAF